MILGYAIAVIVVGALGAMLCLVEALRKRAPNSFTMGATLLLTVLLLARLIISIVAPFAGNTATGDPLEFWMYLIVAFALPIGAESGRSWTGRDGQHLCWVWRTLPLRSWCTGCLSSGARAAPWARVLCVPAYIPEAALGTRKRVTTLKLALRV